MSPAHASADDDLLAAKLRIADVVGGLMEFWGFKRVLGRLWTVLYLAPDPLSAADLGAQLALSTGAISMALSELQKWGVVRKTWRPGERRDFYEPETSIWKMVMRVFRERELTYVREATESFDTVARKLDALARELSGDEAARVRFALDRVRTLQQLASLGEGLLRALLESGSVDIRPFQQYFTRGDNRG